jgi:sulfate-transporting ATPase
VCNRNHRYNFNGGDQQKKVGDLSGGERNRLQLAKTLKSGGNVLLLDEPTNDLDVDTLRSLEEALANFAGTSLVISHDRWFLDRLATHILAYEGNSQLVWFEGSYSEYEVRCITYDINESRDREMVRVFLRDCDGSKT